MAEPMMRMQVDLRVFRFEMAVRTVHVIAGCLGAAAIVAAANVPWGPTRGIPPTATGKRELESAPPNDVGDRMPSLPQ